MSNHTTCYEPQLVLGRWATSNLWNTYL